MLTFAMLACSASSGPSCARAYEALSRSLVELHQSAGRPRPSLPSPEEWIGRCEGHALDPAQLGCLEPETAAADPERCRVALAPVSTAREDLDDLFRRALARDMAP